MIDTLVVKFGGASLKDVSHFENVAKIILEEKKHYANICVVVSAMEGVTDYLLGLADRVHPGSSGREKDMLLSVGERVSMVLLAMTLQKMGADAVSLTGSQTGIITTTEHSDAKIIDVRPVRLEKIFAEGKIPIVAGFQGVSTEKEVTTLGRGGSDTTAVALAVALGAEKAVFYKDVDGVYTKDPKKYADAVIQECLTYDEAISVVGEGKGAVLHPRAIALAKKNQVLLQVRSFKGESRDKEGSKVYFVGNTEERGFKCYESPEILEAIG